MGLKELGPKGLYDSDTDDILSDFYIPALSEAVSYKRIAGYFSSNALAIAARGVTKFIENGGRMSLIANVVLSENDQRTIKEAIEERERVILREIESMDDALKKGHLQLLAWMIKNGTLEIRIASIPNGLEHKKKGILEDEIGDIISFSGSDNETVSGWLYNHEDFHVFCSWIEGDRERHLAPDIHNFDAIWEGRTKRVRVYKVSEAFRKGIIRTAPKDENEFRSLSNEVAEELLRKNQSERKLMDGHQLQLNRSTIHDFLRDYQKEAIESWEGKGRRGILKMATGTGKTFTAIAAMERFLEEKSKGAVVIVAPKQLLVSQWSNELKKLGYTNLVHVMIDSKRWTKELRGALVRVELGHEDEVIAIATYASFCSDNFISIIEGTGLDILLICDEMHNSWAPQYRQGLLSSYPYRLGLSATPERYLDEKGTSQMQSYFGGVVYSLDLKDAIPEFLVPYEYHAEVVELTDEEKLQYDDISTKIARMIAANDGDIDERILGVLLKRSRLVTNSESKWDAFGRILDSIPDMRRTLIYCSDKQIRNVLMTLQARKISAHKITFKEQLKFRKEIIDSFNEDVYRVIVAMKVLDEGIDVPGIERAIILASSGNPIEFVQRRGRVLRRSEGKDHAAIHDVLIFPWSVVPDEVTSAERAMLKKEMKRIREFANASENPCEVMNAVSKYLVTLGGD